MIRMTLQLIAVSIFFLTGLTALASDYETAIKAFDSGDYGIAFSLLTPLADGGNFTAQYYLGRIHAEGLGRPINNKMAAFRFRQSAEGAYGALRSARSAVRQREEKIDRLVRQLYELVRRNRALRETLERLRRELNGPRLRL